MPFIPGKPAFGQSTISFFTTIPTKIIANPLGYLYDVEKGNIHPRGKADYIRGLLTGKSVRE